MTITELHDNFSISGELTESDIDKLKAAGITTLINLRPDGEQPDQTNDAQWQALCESHGIEYVHIPVKPCQYNATDIEKFAHNLHDSSVVHAFCKTGTRAVHLWALANREHLSLEQIRQVIAPKGYNIDMIQDQF
ncbi:TIGR01244 family sulfur transferase [Glaciecola sp. 1036]|uniref:TIGR01244 family sulfur transferase n=1 Tax=Alteromonadaceae TaxID=72275 RepID=UPI003D043B99